MSEQVIKLGIPGLEVELETESRSFTQYGNTLKSLDGRTVDGSLHTDFVNNKRTYTISYTVVSEENKDKITDIYLLQIEENSYLNLIYSEQNGEEGKATVKMEAPVFGAIIPKGDFFYQGVTLNFRETVPFINIISEQFVTSDDLAFVTTDGLSLVALNQL